MMSTSKEIMIGMFRMTDISGISWRSMNVTFIKQGELYMKTVLQKLFSKAYQVYTGVKESIFPDSLQRHLLHVEDLLHNFMKKKH